MASATDFRASSPELVQKHSAYFAPDAVLISCPDCGRDHFVTVDACPDEATAALEAGMVRRAA